MSEELVREIFDIAAAHDRQRYLLPHRPGGPSFPPDERDLRYEACKHLVDRGNARWLTGQMRPGIQLTGKPLE